MAKYSNTVEYNIKTNLDASGVAKLQTQLRQVEAELQRLQGRGVYTEGQVKKDLANINQIKNALKTAFNPSLGMLDNKAFMAGLTKGGKTLQDYAATFNAAGVKGSQAFASWYSQLGKIDTGLKQVSKTGDKIMNTFGNTVRWGLIASAFSQVMNAAHEAVQYVKDLDESLTNIMMVTDYSREAMNEYARSANDAAKALGSTTTAMTNATLVFAQQGFDLPKSQQLAATSTQLANISQQDTATASDEITAYMNAFHLESIDEINNAMSKWAKVANISAADVEELSVASQKAASTAVTVGVNMDQLAAQIAAIETVTREAPENIGNGLKTLYARFSDISMGETLEDGVDLGKVTSTLQKVGVDVLTAEGNMRQVGDIMEDLMAVWGDLDLTQRSSVATTLAGKFQLSRFTALMNRSDLYSEYLAGSEGETGTATFDEMQAKFEDSMQGRLNKLQSTIEGIFTNAMDTDSFYGMIDAVTQLVQLFSDLTEAIGGGGAALTAFGAILTKVMSNNISRGLANFTANRQRDAMVSSNIESARLNAQEQLQGQGVQLNDADAQRVVNDTAQGAQYAHLMNQEQLDKFNQSLQQRTQILGALKAAEAEATESARMLGAAFATAGVGSEAAERGIIAFLEMLNEAGASIDKATFDTKEFGNTLGNLSNAQQGLTNLAAGFERVEKAEKEAGQGSVAWTEAVNGTITTAHRLSAKLKELANSENLSAEQKEKIIQISKMAESVQNGDWQSLKKLQAAIKENQLEVNLYIEALSKLRNEGVITSEVFEKITNEVMRQREAFEAGSTSAQIFNAQMQKQSNMNGIVDAAASIGQLAFAWQAFKSLGSLWAKEDVDLGQKIEETVLNLSMNLPMLIMGFNQLKTAAKNPVWTSFPEKMTKTAAAQKAAGLSSITAAGGIRQAGAAATATAAKNSLLAASSRTAAVAVKGLGAALTFMSGPWGIAITAAIMAISTAVSFLSQQSEEAYNKAKENADEAISNYNSISDKITSFNDLYKKYQETGEVSDELVNTSKELANTLGLTGGEAQIAAGRFDLLASSIEEADKKQREMAERDIESFLAGSNAQSLQGSLLGISNGSIYEDIIKGMGGRAVYNEYGEQIAEEGLGVSDVELAKANNSPAEAIAAARKTIKQYNEEIDQLEEDIATKAANGEDTASLEQTKKAKLAQIEKINEALSTEDIADYMAKSKELADLKAQDIASKITDESTLEEIQAAYNSDQYIADYLTSLGNWSDQLAWMIQNTSNETAKLTLMLTQSQESFSEQAQQKINSSLTANGINSSDLGIADQTEYSKQTAQGMLDQISNSGLTEKEQLEFIVSIDWNQSLAEIQSQIEELKVSGELPKLEFEAQMTDRSDFSDQETEDILKEADMSEASLNRMSADIFDSDAMQASAEKVKTAIQDVENRINSGAITAEEGAAEIKKLRQRYEDLGDTAKDIATYNTKMNSGVSKLTKNWKKLGEVLEDDAAKGTSDYYQALGELDEIMSEILNIDTGVLSQGFFQNAEALDAMQRAADGDVSAIDDLRHLAAEDIILNLEVNDISDEDYDYLINQELLPMMNDLQSYIDSIPLDMQVGADLMDQPFIVKLNELLSKSQITAEQASNILSSMGVDATIRTEKQKVTQHHTAAYPVYKSEVKDGVTFYSVDHVEQIGYNSEDEIAIPYIQGAAYTGSGVQTVGASSSGNTGKSPGGGGGGKGGGKDKAEEPKDVAHKEAGEAEKDIYEKVNAELEKLKDNYSRVKKERDKAWGQKTIIQNANKELGLLQAQNKALDKRIKISKEYQKALLGDAKLKEKYNVKNSLDEYGLTDKDLDGVVDNYSQQWDVAKKLAEKAQKEADDYFKAHGGKTGKDQYGNTVIIQDAQMLEAESNHYEELTKTAENAWEIVKQINDVTKEYEDTANKIRDDEEEQLDLLWEMDQIQIDMYERALDALDTLEEMADMMAKMKGMWSGFELDSPFRAMVEDVQEIKDLFAGDTKKEINDYYNNIYDNIAKNDRLTKKEKDEATKFFKQQQKNATSANGYNGLGFGELARESRKLAELQAMETNTAVRDLVYGPTQEGYEQWLDELEKQTKKVEEMALSAEEAWDKAQENIIDALDEEMDKLDKLYDKYDDIIDRVEREADRVSLFHGDDQYADLSKLADQTGKVQLEKAKKYQQEYDYWEKKQNAIKEEEERERNRRIKEAKQLLNDASTAEEIANANLVMEQAKQYHSDEWEWYDEKMQEAQENVLDAQDAAAEAFKDAYELAIDEIEAKWLESALGTRDTNYLEDDWSRDKDYMTTYKDDYERNYEVQKLNYKWQQMLNDALGSSLATQRKIRNEGQAIVDQLANQTTMSEYDVKLANARLEILQKQIALENAQQNKNQMKLRRDTQGNYKYVYAADQNDVGEKQQDLLDSIYDVWEISKDQSIGSTDNYIEAVQNAGEKAKEIWNDASLTIEQKQALIAELMADTGRLLEAISEDAGDSFNGMISAVVLGSGIGLENVSEMCANVLDALLTHNEEAIEGIGVPWDQFLGDLLVPEDGKSNIPGIAEAFKNAMDDCKNANQNFLDEIQGPEGVAAVTGEEYGKAQTAIDNAKDSTNDLYNETLKLYTLFGMESKALDEAKKTMEGYKKALDAATSGSGKFAKQIQDANDSVVKAAKASGNWITAPGKVSDTASGQTDANAISVQKVNSVATSKVSNATSGGVGNNGGYSGGGGGSGGSTGHYEVWSDHGDLVASGSTRAEALANAKGWEDLGLHVKQFATGGYTGSWSDGGIDEKNGKLAILHQKELVLNAVDTKNILTAVELVRQSTDLLKNASLSDAISKSGGIVTQTRQSEAIVSQPVTISAEFPNANSVDEIREALLSLTDAASQYAYRVGGGSPSTGRFTQGTYF